MTASFAWDFVFRVNAGGQAGLGHLRRTLVLAQALRARGIRKIAFVTRTPGPLKQFLPPVFHLIAIPVNERETVFWERFSKTQRASLVFIDSYDITARTLKEMRRFLPRIAMIDDFKHLSEYPVDVLVNPNIYAKEIHYRTLPTTKRLFGPQFALIDSFFTSGPKGTRNGKKPRFYAALGGLPGMQSLKRLVRIFTPFQDRFRVDIATGMSDNWPQLSRGSSIRFVRHEKARAAMKACDFALTASGVTSSELAAMGKPMLLLILARNQEAIARSMHRHQMALTLGWFPKLKEAAIRKAIEQLISSPPLQRRLSRNARRIIDGKGADRLARAFIRIIHMKEKK